MENVKIKLSSGRVAELREIKAREMMNADRCSEGDPVLLGYYRVAAAIAKLDEQELPTNVTSKLALDAIIDRLSGQEMDELGGIYAIKYGPRAEVLKNEESPTSES